MDTTKTNSLPYMKHFGDGAIGKAADSFRKGEWTLFTIIKLALGGAALYFSWIYVLPPIFQAIGQMLAIVSTIVIIVALAIMTPTIIKGIRRFTRFLHKLMINHEPFAELEDQQKLMGKNKEKFQVAKGKIDGLKKKTRDSSIKAEKDAKQLEDDIVRLHTRAEKSQIEIEQRTSKEGDVFKESDEYVNLRTELRKTVSKAERYGHKLAQEKVFVNKYGARLVVMKNMSQKLTWIATDIDIKIDDFKVTIEILKREYEFAKESRAASTAAKDAMVFDDTWQVEYALDVVTNTISADLAITMGNFNDIDMITSLPPDSDEMYDKLDKLAESIKTGSDPVPSAKKFDKEGYKPTYAEKVDSGFPEEMF